EKDGGVTLTQITRFVHLSSSFFFSSPCPLCLRGESCIPKLGDLMPPKARKLGNSGFHVAPLAFGGNVFGWTADEQTSFRLLDAFVDAGFNLIDTADVYSRWAPGNQGGES